MKRFKKIIEYLFYLYVFLLPWQTHQLYQETKIGGIFSQFLSYRLYLTEIILALIIILVILTRQKQKKSESIIPFFKVFDIYLLIFLLFIVIIITGYFAADGNTSYYYFIKMLEGFTLLIFILNFTINKIKLSFSLIFAGLIQAILAIWQFLSQQVIASKWLGMATQYPDLAGSSVIEVGAYRFLRAYGSLSHPNILGGFLAICLVILIINILVTKNKYSKIFYGICLPIIITGFFLSFSKSAFLAFIIALMFLAIFIYSCSVRDLKLKFSQVLLIIITTFSILILFNQQLVITRLEANSRLEIMSSQQRLDQFKTASQVITQYWLTGTGLGNYTLVLADQDGYKQPAYYYQPVHNVYVLILAELGVIGFILFILLLIEAIRKIYTYKLNQNLRLINIFNRFKFLGMFDLYMNKYLWFLGYSSVFIMILIIMAFDHYWWTMYFGIILWWLCFALWLKQVSLNK